MERKLFGFALLLPLFLAGCGEQAATSQSSESFSSESSSITSSESSSSSLSSESSSEETTSESSESSESTRSSSSSSSSRETSSSEEYKIPDYVLHGQFHGDSEWTDKAMTKNEHNSREYMIQGVSLYDDDVFKVHMAGNTWYGYGALKRSCPAGLVTQAPTDDNIKVLVTGIYDIYSSYDESDGGHIYLARTDGEASSSASSASTVSVTGVTLDRKGKFLVVRNEFILTATVSPSNASNKEIRWSSSDTSIATVTSGGRVVGVAKGSATITAKTVDGNKTATCLVYVSTSGIPDYYLTGTIHGRSYPTGTYTYAAVPTGTGTYLISDIELLSGDELTVTDSHGAKLKNKTNQTYTVSISKNRSVHAYLDVNDASKNYLTLVDK